MRPLIWLRHDVDLLNSAKLIDLARESAFARPFRGRPWRAFLRMRILVVLALESKRLIAPRELQKTEDFLEGLTINAIGLALIAERRAHIDLLRHPVQPSSLLAARKPNIRAALGQLIDPRDLNREPDRLPSP